MAVIAFGPFRLLVRERRLERDRSEVKVGSRALAVLTTLAQRAGMVVGHEELRTSVWPDTSVEESGLRVQVAALRRALGEYGASYVTNVPGRGYCFVAPIAQGALPEAAPTRTLDRGGQAHGLPAQLDRILGREAELERVSSLASDHRVVSVVAAGGMGKSTVAVAVGHALRHRFNEDIRYIDLASLGEEHVLSAVASIVGISPMEPLNRLVAFLEHRHLLLLLDGCEHVIASAASLVRALVAGTSGVHVLATSREPMRIEGERVFRLAPLSAPPESEALTSQEAMTFAAVQLFVDRATTAGAQLSSTDEEARTIARMCRQLDGIALAIEVAAGRAEAYGVLETAALVDTRFKLLWRGRRTAVTRHQTLAAMLDWSYNLLTDLERTVLRRLSVLAGAASMELVHAVACSNSDDPDAVFDALAALVEKSLVAVDSADQTTRYRLLETTRAYAHSKLAEAEARGAWERLGAFLVRTLTDESSEPSPAGGARPGHLACVRATLGWAFSSAGDPALAVALAESAGPLFMEQSLLLDAERWSRAALSILSEADTGTRREMNLQATLGLSALSLSGNTVMAHAAVTRALTLADPLRDGWLQIGLLAASNLFETRAARYREALASADEAGSVAQRMADPEANTLSEWLKGRSEHLLGRPSRAERLCRSAVASQPTSRLAVRLLAFDHRLAAVVTLARVLWLLGRPDEARSVARRVTEEAIDLGKPINVAMGFAYTSTVFRWCGDFDAAEELVERLMIYTRRNGPDYVQRLLGPALRAELAVRRARADVGPLKDAMAALAAAGHLIWQSAFATTVSEALMSLGKIEEALSVIDEAIASATAYGGSYDLPEMLRVRGQILAARAGNAFDEAEQCLLRSLDSAQQQGALAWELRTATTLAALWSKRGRDRDARDLVLPRYERFTQGLDTEDLKVARHLLSGL